VINKINFIGVFLLITPIKLISWRSQIASLEVAIANDTGITGKLILERVGSLLGITFLIDTDSCVEGDNSDNKNNLDTSLERE
jgi:hypothetical protein